MRALVDEFGSTHDFATVDVADDAQVRGWAERLIPEHGAPDLLVNNAGIITEFAPLWKVSGEDFSRIVDVNVKGVANTIRHFVPAMVERGRGVIVNLSSGWGRSTSPEVAPYCATKWAIEGLSKALADELPSGLASIPLSPGVIDTDMLRSAWGEGAGSYPSPDEWAKSAVPFLLSLGPEHSGQSLSVPGH